MSATPSLDRLGAKKKCTTPENSIQGNRLPGYYW